MTQIKHGASQIGRRLFKSAATSALALSALAGGVMLSSGEAKALTYFDPGLGITFTDTINVIDGAIGGTVELEATGQFYPNSQKQVDINYAPTPLLVNDVVLYTINKTGIKNGVPVKVWFDEVSLAINAVAGAGQPLLPTVTKEVFAVDPSTPGSTPIAVLTRDSANPGNINKPLPNMYDHLWVRDTLTPNGGRIDNAINDFRNVPGPLPILGAGAAFGFSRKLRGRIKASRTA